MSGYAFSLTPKQVPYVSTNYRNIQTMIPVPESVSIFESLERYESRSMHGQLPVVWDRAEDFQVFDPYGNSWIDFTSTISQSVDFNSFSKTNLSSGFICKNQIS